MRLVPLLYTLLPLLSLGACWHPPPVDVPAARIHTEEAVADDAGGDAITDGTAEDGMAADGPALNPNPDGLDPYVAVTVVAPITLVDDGGKPVAVLNTLGAKVEVRQEDGGVRRKVWCSFCAPPTEGWVRTEEIALAKVN